MARREWLWRLAVIGSALGLGGCLTTTGAVILGADTATQLATGRSIQGNVMYAFTGKDCAPANVLVGRPMCREPEEEKVEAPQIYCYRTLGQVACHSEPDLWMSAERRLYPNSAEPATAPPFLAER